MSFTGYLHIGNSAFEFMPQRLQENGDSHHGEGWAMFGDSLAVSENAVCAFHGVLTNRRELCHEFNLPEDTSPQQLMLNIHLNGKAASQTLRGSFCFAIIDTASRKLLLVRDQLGCDSLYHTALPNGTHVFSTSLNNLRRLPGVSSQISLQALFDYLSR